MSVKLRPHAAPAALVSLAVVLALAVVAVVALSGAEAASKQPKCGDTITKDTTLHHDLINCPNNGIRIGADDVTLDLNGHTIDGDGKPFAACGKRETCDSGVVNECCAGVTVMHGSVREFAFLGVNLGPARHGRPLRDARVLDLSAVRNGAAGIACFKCPRALVRNSSGNRSDERGLWLLGGHHVRVLHSSFRHNGESGIELFGSARFDIPRPNHDLIKGNQFSRNGAFGIVLERAARNQVRRNRSVRDGAIGIYLAPAERNVIAENRVFDTRGREHEGVGIEIDGGGDNLFARNSIRDTSGPGIAVGFVDIPDVGNVVRGNHTRRAGKDGVFVDAGAKHTLLKGNRAVGSKGDGLDANNPTTKLTGNRALRNHDLGIEAVRGVIDGGGNIARHNGDPRRCTNIVCG